MSGATFIHGPRRPGWVYLGTGPKTGQPRDAQGRMILVHEYGPPAHTPIAPLAAELEPPRVARGILATTEQGKLI